MTFTVGCVVSRKLTNVNVDCFVCVLPVFIVHKETNTQTKIRKGICDYIFLIDFTLISKPHSVFTISAIIIHSARQYMNEFLHAYTHSHTHKVVSNELICNGKQDKKERHRV